MGLPAIEPGTKCEHLIISATPGQIARWERRVAEEKAKGSPYASRSGVIRQDGDAVPRLKRRAREPLSAMRLALDAHAGGTLDAPELLGICRRSLATLAELLKDE